MTIDSSWLAAFKREHPHAFRPAAPFRYKAAFVDGQIKLMQTPRGAQTWDEYIERQFVRHLSKFLEVADTVILAFDNYDHVPIAKSMTQHARRKKVPIEFFGETSPLPCLVPESTCWMAQILNRTFKARVIELVCLRLPQRLLEKWPAKQLIIDYRDCTQYSFVDGKAVARTLEMKPLGEADVKFARYSDMFDKLIVDSIDGDSVPIALVHHELCLSRGICPPRVAIYRLEIKTEPDPETAKRKREEGRVAPRKYEYLDILPLYEALKDVVGQCLNRARMPTHENHEIRMLVCMMALTGTDFSRGLPQISGASVYEFLPDAWAALASAYDPAADQLRVEHANRLVGTLYAAKYPKWCGKGLRRAYPDILSELRASKLSDRTKTNLASAARIETTLRNVNWVLQYWTCEACPDPVSPQFGYRLEREGVAQYADA